MVPAPPDDVAAPLRRDHWRRFRRLMWMMLAIALVSVTAAILWLRHLGTPMPLHFIIAMALGISLSLLLTGALMGLVFVSARSGHDDEAHVPPPHDP